MTDRMKLRPKEELIIAGMDWDFSFTAAEIKDISKMWADEIPLPDIAEKLKRKNQEIAVMIMDLATYGKIKRRKYGVYGGEEVKEVKHG